MKKISSIVNVLEAEKPSKTLKLIHIFLKLTIAIVEQKDMQ